MTPIAPYNNQPITAINSLKAGAMQPYLQRAQNLENHSGGDFLTILYDALKTSGTIANTPTNDKFQTILSKEVQNLNLIGQDNGERLASNASGTNAQSTNQFFTMFGGIYQDLMSNNEDAHASNFTTLLADKKEQNSLFSTASDIRRAIKSYEQSSMLAPTGGSFLA
ncbi:MAG: hypothetical protein K2O85_09235 [Helicobacter sp.]|nr:hypothetical protein [Helicobacter sp.]